MHLYKMLKMLVEVRLDAVVLPSLRKTLVVLVLPMLSINSGVINWDPVKILLSPLMVKIHGLKSVLTILYSLLDATSLVKELNSLLVKILPNWSYPNIVVCMSPLVVTLLCSTKKNSKDNLLLIRSLSLVFQMDLWFSLNHHSIQLPMKVQLTTNSREIIELI